MDLLPGKRLRELPGPVLITGHTGFKGTWLTFLLERLGVPVIGYSLAPEPNSLFDRSNRTGAIPEEFADIRDFAPVYAFIAKHRPSAIFHMAAQPLVLESYEVPRETFETNVMGTVNILDAAFKTDSVEAVVVVTTDKVYRNDNSGRPFVESDALMGKDPYSASKVGAESAVAAWQQISKVFGGPKVVAVRAGNVIGGGDWAEHRLIPDLIRGFMSGGPIQIRNPESTRPWQHVLDPLIGYLMALESVLGGKEIPVLNFGPNLESLPVRRVVELAIQSWPRPAKVDFLVPELAEITEASNLRLDSNLAFQLLEWKPAWDQSAAVNASIRWWKRVLIDLVSPFDECLVDIEYLLNQMSE